MRKLFWCGTFVMVAAAVAISFAATLGARSPGSVLAGMTYFVSSIGKQHGPVSEGEAVPGEQEESEAAENCPLGSPCDTCVPVEPLSESEERKTFWLPASVSEPINVLATSHVSGELNPAGSLPVIDPAAGQHILPEAIPGFILIEDECPDFMPRCQDDESGPPPVGRKGAGNGDLAVPGCCLEVIPEQQPASCPKCQGSDKPSCCPDCPKCGKPASKAQNKENSTGEEQEAGIPQPGSLSPTTVQKRLEKLLAPFKPCENSPSARKLDTMEFRPSDARKGEFDPTPF